MSTDSKSEIYAVLKGYADAWAASDFATVMNAYHDEIVFHYSGRNPFAGTHRGKSACLAVLKQVREKSNRQLIEIQDVMAGDQFGVVLARECFERDGRRVVLNRVFKYVVRDGKLSECWVYDEDQPMIDALWT